MDRPTDTLTTADMAAITRNPWCPPSLADAWHHLIRTANNRASALRRRNHDDFDYWSSANDRALAVLDNALTRDAELIPALIAGEDPYAVPPALTTI